MLRIINRNRNTLYGREHGFDEIRTMSDFRSLKPTDYTDYIPYIEKIRVGEGNVLTADTVRILQPTSGTSSGVKLIPYTEMLGAEFKSALDAWVSDLFLGWPKLFSGTQYWAISPVTKNQDDGSGVVQVGFLDDIEYFGKMSGVMSRIMAVPSHVRMISDIDTVRYVTLLYLLRQRRLTLISVWHPSFLILMLDCLRSNWERLLDDVEKGGVSGGIRVPDDVALCYAAELKPEPQRAAGLRALDRDADDFLVKVWPHLQVISFWTDGGVSGREIRHVEKCFPGVYIQGKGLLATEGVISIPFGRCDGHVCAVTSHFLEFQDDAGDIFPVWRLKDGEEYKVLITTGGGLYRYQLNDRIRVAGHLHRVPRIKFIGRGNVVSDCVGEKLHLAHVENVIGNIVEEYFNDAVEFAVLVSVTDGLRHAYTLFVEPADGSAGDAEEAATVLESGLRSNYHYAYARDAGQLGGAKVALLERGAKKRYTEFMIKRGMAAGTIKYSALGVTEDVRDYIAGEEANHKIR
jgi:hypothetical protein